jgi:S-adenosylmethionine:tRNA ribosyltransferase-isomerase
MKTEDFNYFLPEELIAQNPLLDRSASRLMVVDKKTGEYRDETFKNILKYFKKGDCLVLNNTKVIPAGIIGKKEETDASIELLLLKDLGNDIWEALVKPAKRIKTDTIISFGEGLLSAKCITNLGEGIMHFKLIF